MESASENRLFVGTYTKTSSRGIYTSRLDLASGALSPPELAVATSTPTFLAFGAGEKFLYAVQDSPAIAAAFAVDATRGRLEPLAPPPPEHATAPCHVAVDRTGRVLLVTNFHTGVIAAMPILAGGGLGTHPTRQATAHPHSSTYSPDNRFALVCDLGLDRIYSYHLDVARPALAAAEPPYVEVAPGSGPRHFTFGPDGRRAYVINEIASTIVAFDYDPARGSLAPRQTISTLPAGFTGTSSAAEIRIHPQGRFLYGSNRGHDSLASFVIDPVTGGLSPLETVPCGGRGPRHFAFSPDGNWLVCAHQESDSLTSFRVDAATGRLTPTGHSISVGTPVCVLFVG